jgi:hypothetical protein
MMRDDEIDAPVADLVARAERAEAERDEARALLWKARAYVKQDATPGRSPIHAALLARIDAALAPKETGND